MDQVNDEQSVPVLRVSNSGLRYLGALGPALFVAFVVFSVLWWVTGGLGPVRQNWSGLALASSVGVICLFELSRQMRRERELVCPRCSRLLIHSGWSELPEYSPILFRCPDCHVDWDSGMNTGRRL